MIEVKETTYEVEGSVEPCFEVTDGFTMVRIAPFYHYYGRTTILITEYLGGEFNSSDDWDLTWDYVEESEAKEIAINYSAYLR